MKYQGMNQQTGKALTDTDHIRQSVRDILVTPLGSRIARRDYGSLIFKLMDQPQNAATRLQVMAATYSALSKWEPRITLDTINITSAFDGSMDVELSGQRSDGAPLSLSVSTGVNSGSH